MKRLVVVNGIMGVGKSTACQEMKKLLPPCVYLDGDWRWDMNPFLVTLKNKEMVLENISFLLRNFMENPALETVIFGWVLPGEEILTELRQRLTGIAFREYDFTLQCTQKALRERMDEKTGRGGGEEPGTIPIEAGAKPQAI